MSSRGSNGGVPWARHQASKSVQVSRWTRSDSSRNAAHSDRSSIGSPENVGGMSSPRTSSGLHDTIRTNAASDVMRAGKETTLSSTTTSGRCSAMIWRSRGSAYFAPSIERLVRRVDERRELVAGRLGELRRGLVDEVDPELAGRTLGRIGVGLGEVDQRLDEAVRRQPAGPRRLRGEHHAVTPVEQHLAQPDALVGRPVRRLRHEHHGQLIGHEGTLSAAVVRVRRLAG